MATIDIIQKLAGESGLLISLVVIMRLLPTLFLFPAAGVVADRHALCYSTAEYCLLMYNDCRLRQSGISLPGWWFLLCLTGCKGMCRFPRENILITSNVIAGIVAACLTFITTPHRIW